MLSDGPNSLCEPVTTTANEAKKLRDLFLENYLYKPWDSAPLSIRRGEGNVSSAAGRAIYKMRILRQGGVCYRRH